MQTETLYRLLPLEWHCGMTNGFGRYYYAYSITGVYHIQPTNNLQRDHGCGNYLWYFDENGKTPGKSPWIFAENEDECKRQATEFRWWHELRMWLTPVEVTKQS